MNKTAPSLLQQLAPLFGACLLICLTGCGGGKAPPSGADIGDRDLLNASTSAQQAFNRGTPDLACDLYRRSLARARLLDDSAAVADQAYNLAVVSMAAGRLDETSDALDEAEIALRRTLMPRADVLLVRARLVYAQAETAGATGLKAADEAALRVLSDPNSRPANLHRVAVALLGAEIACDRHDADAASRNLAIAKAIRQQDPSAGGAPSIARVTARIHLLQGNPAAAGFAFDDEAQLQARSRRFPELARALSNSGRSWMQAGDAATSADRAYRAAACWLSQERKPQALAALEAARIGASIVKDEALLKRTASLAKEIDRLPDPVLPLTRNGGASTRPVTVP